MNRKVLALTGALAFLVLIGALALLLLPRGADAPASTAPIAAAENTQAPAQTQAAQTQPAPETLPAETVPAGTQPAPAESQQLPSEPETQEPQPQTTRAQAGQPFESYVISPSAPDPTRGYHQGSGLLPTREHINPTVPPLPRSEDPEPGAADPTDEPETPEEGSPLPGAGAVAYGTLTPPPEASPRGIAPEVLFGDDGLAMPILP